MIIQKQDGKAVPLQPSNKEKFKMVAKTMMGLEEVLADELRECGATNIECINRAVTFEGDMRVLYRANYTCRTALAILKPFAEFDANSDQELYDKVYQIRWEKILDVDCTFMIDSTTSGEIFTHSYYAALKTKDAIVDRFRRNFGQRPSIDTENADYKFNLHIRDNHVTLLINSSGDSLHKRGYRQAVGIAPINEVLAAGMIKLAGWKCDCNFYDPMCGSGTILIEAAMMANRIPAQYYRDDRFAFKRWKEFNLGEWKSIKQQEDRKIGSLDFEYEIWGNDIDLTVLQQAEKNLEYTILRGPGPARRPHPHRHQPALRRAHQDRGPQRHVPAAGRHLQAEIRQRLRSVAHHLRLRGAEACGAQTLQKDTPAQRTARLPIRAVPAL